MTILFSIYNAAVFKLLPQVSHNISFTLAFIIIMHYDYFEFQHTMSDTQRVEYLRQCYEQIFSIVVEGTYRNINRVMKHLRTSQFYSIPCRHHQFVGGNAWHQLETFCYAFAPSCPAGSELCSSFAEQQPLWLASDKLSMAIVCLLHDLGNVPGVEFPSRILKRHGRRSTYVLADKLKFELMFDENMSIIYHQFHDFEELRYAVSDQEMLHRIWEFPLFRMIQHCDTLSITHRLTEGQLTQAVEHVLQQLQSAAQ